MIERRGIGDLAFYLMVNGGTHPRGKTTVVVNGIGISAAARIYYLALRDYLLGLDGYVAAAEKTARVAQEQWLITTDGRQTSEKARHLETRTPVKLRAIESEKHYRAMLGFMEGLLDEIGDRESHPLMGLLDIASEALNGKREINDK